MIRTMKIIRNLTLLAMLLLSLGAWAEDVNVSSPGNFATRQIHSGSIYCYSLTGGNTYILQNDVSMDAHIHIPRGETVTIDLNNHTLSRGLAGAYGWGFVIYNEGGNLTITDTSNDKRGIITGGYNYDDGSGIYNNSGTLTIEGGTISGNHAARNGGAIYIKTGTLNLKGGTITNNIANNQGAGIYVESDGTMNMQGAPTITGNRVGSSNNNLFLSNNVVINIDAGGLNGSVGSIGITKDSPGLITTALDNATRYQIFVSDKNNCETTNVVDNTENKAYYQTCWMGLANQMNAGGDISLSTAKVYEAYSTDPCLTVPSGKTVNLDLNGLTLNRGKSSAEPDGCAIKVESGGTLTISGSGTIKGGKNSSGGGGIQNLGTLTISGGTIIENTSTSWGGGIHNEGTLNISGGIIEQNTASGCNGGGIHNTGKLNITGGTIQSNSATGLGAGIYHDGATFNLQGAPYISDNASNNVYLTTDHHIITINGTLSNTTAIGITMQTLGIFTSGLNTKGTIANFSSEESTTVKLVTGAGNEAELLTYWNHLNRLLALDSGETSYELEAGKTYQATDGDAYLHVPSGKTFTLSLGGRTLNRNLSSATNEGCVIYNEGDLTINGSGIITGGKNSDLGTTRGGGICNTGTLTIAGGTISNNTTAQCGGGIYNTGTLNIQGGTIQSNTASEKGSGIYHNGTKFSLQGSPTISSNTTNNVYLETGKTIAISGTLNNNTAIGIASTESRIVFTSGLSGKGDASKFTTNQSGKGIGLNSAGEAIIGPNYNIGRNHTGTSATLYIKDVTSGTQTAVEGEVVKVKVVASGGIPISLGYSPGASLSTYPKSNEEYSFVMPASDVTVASVCRWGGYCGAASQEDIKYYIDENQVLKFITKDDNPYLMATYGAGAAPWVNQTYTSVEIPKQLTAISDYVFCDKNQHLASFTVDADNPNFKADGGLLFKKDENNTLICYPSGKTGATYTVPATVKAIQDGAFAFNTTLKTISVAGGSSFTAGADGVLYSYDGTSLICYPAGKTETSYTIAATVTAIKPYAFQSCSNLDYVYVLPTSVPTGGVAMFDGTKNTLKIMVPKDALENYKTNWSTYESIIYAIDGTTLVITLSTNPNDYDYYGSVVKPDVTEVRSLVGDGKVLVKGEDYSETYTYTNNNAIGTGTVTVTGIGNYDGISASKDFDITKKVEIAGATGHYSTYYHAEAVILTVPDGLTAYTISSVDWNAGTTELSSALSCIPPSTPVLLYKSSGNCNGTYHLKKVETGSVTPAEAFKGKSDKDNDEARSFATLSSGSKAIYVLKGDKFYQATSGVLGANRCYLAEPNTAGSRGLSVISIGNGDGSTGINTPPNDDGEEMSGNWYTLDGRKLQGKPTQKGVYISNGKKMVIK